ncbi:MAG: AMP-binding protein [Thaumarchaeota archaeon]|nr:AMP-binding protein [Candidatus Calditenuaceae archaeon]MDW8187147.1 AMP-binding protein [Nitrososphaerota archaeon]
MSQGEVVQRRRAPRIVRSVKGEGEPPAVMDWETLPKLLRDRARTSGSKVASRWKRLGVWREYTWSEVYDIVRRYAAGLKVLGVVKRGSVVATIGDNRPHQFWTWLAAQSLGGIGGAIYADSLPHEIAAQMNLMRAPVIFAEDQEQVDKVLMRADEMPSLRCVIYRDPKGMFRYKDRDHPQIISFDEVLSMGSEDSDSIERELENGHADDAAMLVSTSGTTGMPKRATLTHRNYISQARGLAAVDKAPEGADYFSFLPMAWIGEQMMSVGALVNGYVINFPEEPETLRRDFREIGPEIIFTSPRWYEAWHGEIESRIQDSTRLKKLFYKIAIDVGYRYVENPDSASIKFLHKLLYWIMYRSILDKLGLKRVKKAYTGGAPISPEHFRYFRAIGLPLKQIWGMTEMVGIVCLHREEDISRRKKYHTVGSPIAGMEIGITEEGEIVCRGPMVMKGYWMEPKKTADTIDEEGWFHTEDFGHIDEDGNLVYYDRIEDVIRLADGRRIPPIYIETKLKFNPYIKESCVVGEGRDWLAAMIAIRYETVSEWAETKGISFTGYPDLSQKPEVIELVKRGVVEVNATLPEHMKIRRFVLLTKEFDPDDDELTRTRKLRRRVINMRYKELIDAIYAGASEGPVYYTLRYKDGREAQVSYRLKVVNVE